MRDANWIELFGCDEIAPFPKDAPVLEMDDPLFWEFRSVRTGAGDGLVKQVEFDELTSALLGQPIEPATERRLFAGADDELPELEMMKRSTGPSRRKIINDRLDAKFYRHEIRDKYNEMLFVFDAQGADALPDSELFRKASAFLGA